jgi:Holliday junction resolvase RusA-like endonuclease
MSEPLVYVVIEERAYAENKKQRPYTDKQTGKAMMGPRTDEPRQKAFKVQAALEMRRAMRAAGYAKPLSGPLRVLITRRKPSPKAPTQETPDLLYDTSRPDWDNLAKLIGDAGTGELWEDDRMIVEGTVRKEHGATWQVLITVWDAIP